VCNQADFDAVVSVTLCLLPLRIADCAVWRRRPSRQQALIHKKPQAERASCVKHAYG